MRSGLFAILVLWTATSAAQTTYKCLDERGRVTYSNLTCEKQGLKDGGQVSDRTTTLAMPPVASPAQKPVPSKPSAAKGDSELGPMQAPAEIKPVVPLLEKLLK